MALIDVVKEITSGYEVEESSFCGLGFGKGQILNLKENVTQELFTDMFAKICKIFGFPSYVHFFYGYIWQKDGEILAYNLYEKQYHYDVVTIFILKRMPLGKKVKFEEYAKLDGLVRETLSEHELIYNNFLHYDYIDGAYTIWGVNAKTVCLVTIKKNSLKFYCSKKEPYENGMTQVVPHYSQKKHITLRNLDTVQQALEDCLNFEQKDEL